MVVETGDSAVEDSGSVWEELCRRASRLRARYAYLPNRPLSTWSLVGRAAQRFNDLSFDEAHDRDHLYALWTKAMCSALNDLARRAHVERASSQIADPWVNPEDPPIAAIDHLSAALERLEEQEGTTGGRKAQVVALRYFDGLSWKEISRQLDVPVSTLRRDWSLTRAWLRRELKRSGVHFP
jgi:RNA polymerase sigma-70 factor, ECF subfamily